jgi:hypothetical protein
MGPARVWAHQRVHQPVPYSGQHLTQDAGKPCNCEGNWTGSKHRAARASRAQEPNNHAHYQGKLCCIVQPPTCNDTTWHSGWQPYQSLPQHGRAVFRSGTSGEPGFPWNQRQNLNRALLHQVQRLPQSRTRTFVESRKDIKWCLSGNNKPDSA